MYTFSSAVKLILDSNSNLFSLFRRTPNRKRIEELLHDRDNPASECIIDFLTKFFDFELNYTTAKGIEINIEVNYNDANDYVESISENEKNMMIIGEPFCVVGTAMNSHIIIFVTKSGKVYFDNFGDITYVGNSDGEFLENFLSVNV